MSAALTPHTRLSTGLAAAAAGLLALSACGEGDAGGTADAEDAFATVTTEFGDVVIEEEPERVVALGWGDAEIALQLGVEPVLSLIHI